MEKSSHEDKSILSTDGKGAQPESELSGNGLETPPAKVIENPSSESHNPVSQIDPYSRTPRKLLKKAERLVTRLTSSNPSDFSWSSTGEIRIEGKLIKYSFLPELIAYACRGTKRSQPVGAREFRKFLRKHHLWPRRRTGRGDGSTSASESDSNPEPTLSTPFSASVPQRNVDTEEHIDSETTKFGSKIWFYIGK